MKLGTITTFFTLLITLMTAGIAGAEVKFTPFVSLGVYHRDCALSDPMICKNDNMGSDTPGTIDIGIRADNCKYFFWADECDILWHHQSYVDRGWLIPGLLEFDGQEAQIDMYGFRATWKVEVLSFTIGD